MEEALWNNLYLTGFALADKLNRKNDEWDIICVIPVQTKVGERRTDIVIGHRDCGYDKFVAWHCFDGTDYSWGHYARTIEGAWEEAKEKLKREWGV